MAFVHLAKAYDKVSREGLNIILRELGSPEKLLNIVKIISGWCEGRFTI